MSVASLENGNLTLNSLTINNSQYAEASGYVASQTVISSTVNSTSLSVPNITTATSISTPQVSFPFGTINGTAGGACNISSNGLALFNPSSAVTVLSVPSANNLTVGDGTTTGVVNTSQLILASASFTGTNGGSLNILPDNGSIALFNGSNSVSLTCSGSDTLTIGTGTTNGVINFSQAVLPCGTLNGNAGGALNVITTGGLAVYSTISGTQYSGNGVQIS